MGLAGIARGARDPVVARGHSKKRRARKAETSPFAPGFVLSFALLLWASGAVFFGDALRAEPVVSAFGQFELVQEKVANGLWHFEIREVPKTEPTADQDGTPVDDDRAFFSEQFSPIIASPSNSSYKTVPFPVTQRDGVPSFTVRVTVTETGEIADFFEGVPAAPPASPATGATRERDSRSGASGASGGSGVSGASPETDAGVSGPRDAFTIWPYAPEGKLGGFMFSGPDYTHVMGGGISYDGDDMTVNDLGTVFMPGGPYGARLETSTQARVKISVYQMPACFAFGKNKETAAILVDETRPLIWDFTNTPWTANVAGPLGPRGAVGFYVIVDKDLPSVRKRYMELIGKTPLPPKSVFSPWLADTRNLQNPEQVTRTIEAARALLDFSDTVVFKTSPGFVPDPALIAAAREKGGHVAVSESPYLPADISDYATMENKNYFVRNGGENAPPLRFEIEGKMRSLLDYTDVAAADFYHANFRAPYFQNGVGFFFLYGGEPEYYSSNAWYNGSHDYGLHSHYAWANRFLLMWVKHLRENSVRMAYNFFPKRVFTLARAPFGPVGRYGAGLYTVAPSYIFFSAVESQARAHASLLGADFMTTDFTPLFLDLLAQSNGVMDANTRNLCERWAASVFMSNFPLLFPDAFADEPWAVKMLQIRHMFVPYLYSLAHKAALDGDPISSPLIYHFQDDMDARDATFETMLGPNVLVGGSRLTANLSMATVYVPKGRWYDYFNRQILESSSGRPMDIDTKRDGYYVVPILFKAGSITPTHDPLGKNPGDLAIKIFPGDETASFVLYEDDGESLPSANNFAQTTEFIVSPKSKEGEVTFTIKARVGNLRDSKNTRPYRLEFFGMGRVKSVLLDNQQTIRVNDASLLEDQEGYYALGKRDPNNPASDTGNDELVFKTPPLSLSADHTIVISLE
ncbi:MAG: DUF5110 domain-containing protein [Deltaproteobacteria bacterium]|jgi:alpha-glucosidase (family GH31 glycosyl hydrolase)|nr:DUF5110 domain-containing protein [Deltaproteobacteria bacterium]